ncbi:ankyrin repeat and SOCS box protein 9 isoform 5-T6 [Dama dama]|uniref:ankyrin repeat and SOCS box protein 9 isoform X4 n=1 Tax=Cervus canadensis TaxID=1574408 RepID=UPI001CA31295|nr:ankyrin repeat and SOCS box protein 9 isoform X4 [Cervus canadensis]XP_043753205.1 ankyrin repeat and SOCS box protein 9 isoform X4 [Cervus elaphus]XP_060992572.1 ankyrin repeat and SOCS box protein 9 isoform X5 [Dama dama]
MTGPWKKSRGGREGGMKPCDDRGGDCKDASEEPRNSKDGHPTPEARRDIVSDWSPVHEAAIHGRLLSLRSLINQGWPVNLITADRVSPLHEACLGGHPSCANMLLRHGAQVNGVTVDWHTPLFNACVSGSHECVNLLLQYGASPYPASDLASPIHEAAKRGHVECIESLVAHGADIDQNICHLGTPLYLACENLQVACARKLLESGPSSLMQLCRLRIRKCFGIQQHHKITGLSLPEELKRFLLHM